MSAVTSAELRRLRAAVVEPEASLTREDRCVRAVAYLVAAAKAPGLVFAWSWLLDVLTRRFTDAEVDVFRLAITDAERVIEFQRRVQRVIDRRTAGGR